MKIFLDGIYQQQRDTENQRDLVKLVPISIRKKDRSQGKKKMESVTGLQVVSLQEEKAEGLVKMRVYKPEFSLVFGCNI